jgi:hypothetical protein
MRLVSVVSPSPVATENTTSGSEEADEEGHEGTEGQPIGVAVLSVDSIVPEDVPGNSPKHHIDDPSNEGTDKGETGDKGHEYCPRSVVSCPTKAEEDGKTGQTSSYAKRGQECHRMDRSRRE